MKIGCSKLLIIILRGLKSYWINNKMNSCKDLLVMNLKKS
jgi:hypothetical protein